MISTLFPDFAETMQDFGYGDYQDINGCGFDNVNAKCRIESNSFSGVRNQNRGKTIICAHQKACYCACL